jgi:hypothetical protein
MKYAPFLKTNEEHAEYQHQHNIMACFEKTLLNIFSNISNLTINMRVECESALYALIAQPNGETKQKEVRETISQIARTSASTYRQVKKVLAPIERLLLEDSYTLEAMEGEMRRIKQDIANLEKQGGAFWQKVASFSFDVVSTLGAILLPIADILCFIKPITESFSDRKMTESLETFIARKWEEATKLKRGGSSKQKMRKTEEKVQLRQGLRLVYKDAHNKKYVRLNNQFVHLKEARKMK